MGKLTFNFIRENTSRIIMINDLFKYIYIPQMYSHCSPLVSSFPLFSHFQGKLTVRTGFETVFLPIFMNQNSEHVD